jgi:hypothetical protein
MLKQMDTDGDGKVSDEERAAGMSQFGGSARGGNRESGGTRESGGGSNRGARPEN